MLQQLFGPAQPPGADFQSVINDYLKEYIEVKSLSEFADKVEKVSIIALQYIAVGAAILSLAGWAGLAVNLLTFGIASPITALASMALSPLTSLVTAVVSQIGTIAFEILVLAVASRMAIAGVEGREPTWNNWKLYLPMPSVSQLRNLFNN